MDSENTYLLIDMRDVVVNAFIADSRGGYCLILPAPRTDHRSRFECKEIFKTVPPVEVWKLLLQVKGRIRTAKDIP